MMQHFNQIKENKETIDISVRVVVTDNEYSFYNQGRSGALVFGPSFEKAIDNILAKKSKSVRSKFIQYIPEEPGLNDYGISGRLAIKLDRRVDNEAINIILQAWQVIDDKSSEVYYIHAIFTEKLVCRHLDGAIIILNKNDRNDLFIHDKPHKSNSDYRKQFRLDADILDGGIPLTDFYRIINNHFVIESLNKEYFAPNGIYYLIEEVENDILIQSKRVSLDKLI